MIINLNTNTRITDDGFSGLIAKLIRSGYAVREAYSHSDKMGIVFDSTYEFLTAPQGFEIIDVRLGTCEGCGGNCSPYSDCQTSGTWKTIIFYIHNSTLTTNEQGEILNELGAWVEGLHNIQLSEPKRAYEAAYIPVF